MLNRCVFIMLLTVACSTTVRAATWIDRGHGRVQMNGEIMESACGIHTDDLWQEIVFPPVSVQDISSSRTAEADFSLRLVNCRLEKANGTFWRGVDVTFMGEADSRSDALFALHGDAEGLALQLSDERGEVVQPGSAFSTVSLEGEEQQLNYRLRVIRNGVALKEGEWSAALRFMVAYP